MKSLFFTLLLFIGVSAMAQDGPPQGPPKMDSATMHTMMVKRYQSANLGLSQEQIESVVSINQSLMGDMRKQEKQEKKDRKAEMETLEKAKLERLTSALGDEKLAKKVIDFDKKNKRPGPGGHGGQGRPDGPGDDNTNPS
ncbi:MAG: hypothetical protein DI598_08330 [Pseudopedobacter saltans]|uniref:DUF4890 domain-containing protein n=1 Tax=Pseudopedobacter saltans TaxID=151895 RepID=A0A2W5GTU4_9SPHI|nr:MAG: hypothetical protein DI598_08330 [Pseudopedobacter saltans]